DLLLDPLGHFRMVALEGSELGAEEDEQLDRRRRGDGRVASTRTEDRHLAEEVARPERLEELTLSIHVDRAFENHRKRVARGAFTREHVSGARGPELGALRQVFELGLGQLCKERCIAEARWVDWHE